MQIASAIQFVGSKMNYTSVHHYHYELLLSGATNNEIMNQLIHEVAKKDTGGKWETINLLGVA